MKKSILMTIAVLGLLCQGCTGEEKTAADGLLDRLADLQQKGTMYGHQDDPFYGLTWQYEEGRSDVKETCGDWPAVMGFDLGGIEMADAKNLDSVPFELIRKEIIAQNARGGIVTVSWHPRNPLTGGTAWDVSSNQVVKSILPGGEQAEKFSLWMDRVAEFLESVSKEAGKPVPMIFRPWHEYNGSWFWWGQNLCSNEEFLALWNLLQDRLQEKGLDNLVWSWSPNLSGNLTEEYLLQRFPGAQRIGLIGYDAYQWSEESEGYISQVDADLGVLTDFAARNNILFAITECGNKNLVDYDWWTGVISPLAIKYKACYFLTWRNYRHEFFGPAPQNPDAADFCQMHDNPQVLFLKDVN